MVHCQENLLFAHKTKLCGCSTRKVLEVPDIQGRS